MINNRLKFEYRDDKHYGPKTLFALCDGLVVAKWSKRAEDNYWAISSNEQCDCREKWLNNQYIGNKNAKI